ncbi:hypothetical protein BDW75DRAFT_218592 [Aspergillus navahoensis]
MERPYRLHRHRSSLEGVIVPSSQPLKAEERGLAIRVFDDIIRHFEPVAKSTVGQRELAQNREN